MTEETSLRPAAASGGVVEASTTGDAVTRRPGSLPVVVPGELLEEALRLAGDLLGYVDVIDRGRVIDHVDVWDTFARRRSELERRARGG